MTDLWNYLRDAKKPIVIYGMGNGADKIISVLNSYGIKISGVFASDGFVRKKIFHGFEVTDYNTAKKRFGEMIVLVCFGSSLPEVIENIMRIAREQELYAPDVAVYGNTLFNIEYAREKRDLLTDVYNRLADATSKNVFENTIMYKLTGKIDYLFNCETAQEEVYENILTFTKDEVYFDLGAYRGDTVLEFLKNTKTYKKIVAIEPDIKTYKKLCLATEKIKDIENINAYVCDHVGKGLFNMSGSRGSSAGEGTEIDAICIDALIQKDIPTYIKMDIEGLELSAIMGAQQTICKYKPKMQIAAYHRSEDLIELPIAVLKQNPNYKIYLRHYSCLPAWDVLYFFV